MYCIAPISRGKVAWCSGKNVNTGFVSSPNWRCAVSAKYILHFKDLVKKKKNKKMKFLIDLLKLDFKVK